MTEEEKIRQVLICLDNMQRTISPCKEGGVVCEAKPSYRLFQYRHWTTEIRMPCKEHLKYYIKATRKTKNWKEIKYEEIGEWNETHCR